MKKIKIFILALILFNCIRNNCLAQNNYSHTAIEIYNSGVTFQRQNNYDTAEKKYIQALTIQPNFIEARKNLSIIYYNKALIYYHEEDFNNSIIYAKKALHCGYKTIDCYYIIANGYKNLNDNANAIAIYNKILELNPEDKPAQENLKYVRYLHNEAILNNSINNLPRVPNAPAALYRLIKPSPGITKSTVKKTKYILDLIWSEPNGRIILQEILKKKIPIKITQGAVTANANYRKQKRTILLYGLIPIFSYDVSSLSVNIAFNYISDFYNPNIPPKHRIYDLQVFIHEFGHAFMYCKSSRLQDSLEEELGVSMIGFNSAYKIITGKYLTREQTEEYSKNIFESLLNDSHNQLPVYSGFNNMIQSYGINMPYTELYSNLPLMYKKLLEENKVSPLPNFSVYVNYKH